MEQELLNAARGKDSVTLASEVLLDWAMRLGVPEEMKRPDRSARWLIYVPQVGLEKEGLFFNERTLETGLFLTQREAEGFLHDFLERWPEFKEINYQIVRIEVEE